jgi:hypothetical protein
MRNFGTQIMPPGTSRRGLASEKGTTTRLGFGNWLPSPVRASRVTARRPRGAGSRTKGMLCWLEPAKPLSTSTAVFIATRMAAVRQTSYSTLVYRPHSRPPDFAPSFKTPGGYVGQAVLERIASGAMIGMRPMGLMGRSYESHVSHRSYSYPFPDCDASPK